MRKMSTEWTGAVTSQHADIDSGWAWVVLSASFVAFAILWGQVYSFTIYYVIFLEVFGESRGYTAWIGSLNLSVIEIAAITAGFFISKLGARRTTWLGSTVALLGYIGGFLSQNVTHFIITYGIVVAFGYCLCIYGLLDAVSQYFKKYLYVATGISLAGGGIGIMCFGYFVDWLIEMYGWRGSLLIQGALTFQIFGLATLFFPIYDSGFRESDATNSDIITERDEHYYPMTWGERIKDPRVVILVVGGLLQGVGVLTLYIIYKDLAISKSIGFVFSTTMMVLGIGNVIGRAASGLIMSKVSPIIYYTAVIALCSAVLFVNIYNDSPEVFVILGAIFGYGHGSLCTVMPLVVAYMFGRREIAPTFGYMMFFAGVGTLFGPPFAGYLTDKTGDYTYSLLLSGSFLVASTALSIVLHYYHQKRILKEKSGQIGTSRIPMNFVYTDDSKSNS